MKPKIYINGIASISCQNEDAFENLNFTEYRRNIIPCVDINFKDFIKPMALRRMSKAVKMGLAASKMAMGDAQLEIPGAIITGTGQGCKQDTEKFLETMLDQHEELLSPTSFIQSTHNTVSGQIALDLKCHSYNVTYTQNSASLESAFLDAQMHFLENPKMDPILLGGVEEISEKITGFTRLDGQIKTEEIKNLDLLKNNSPGTIISEGANFFVLSTTRTQNSYAEFTDTTIISSTENIEKEIREFLINNDLSAEDVELVILGNNGDNRFDHFYKNLQENIFSKIQQLAFKHLVGEYDTVSGYALWLACKILKSGEIPEILKLNSVKSKKPRNILIYNQYLGKNHCLMLLRGL